jgi:hypothetical protein
MKYTILCGHSAEDLSRRVQGYLDTGWVLRGAVLVQESKGTMYQVVIKHTKTSPEVIPLTSKSMLCKN